ncbi:MAG TPA: FkbM family methyltransferase [Methylophaga aminisulfidivorans]|uniref:FkbM family methyltransferase n=2 Tax=root TaxID=1 RepID=A0A7C1W6D5_9GAMM|nr:FkbM family methyltransferase [Methylophaga aminisulfidivorans]
MPLFSYLESHYKDKLQADFLEELFCENLAHVIEGKVQVVLYGAGSAGRELVECLKIFNIAIVAFSDSNTSLYGSELEGVPILSLDEVMAKFPDAIFVISSNQFRQEIRLSLKDKGIKRIAYIKDKHQLFSYLQLYKWHYDFDFLKVNKDSLEAAYELLSDKQSIDLYKHRLVLLSSYPDYDLYKSYFDLFAGEIKNIEPDIFNVSKYTPNYESYLYFNNDVIELGDNEVLIDAGAFDGDSAIEFIKACDRQGGSASHVFCIEADTKNFEKLRTNTSGNSKISLINKGLWSSITTLQFASSDNTFLTESRIVEDSIEMNYLHNCVDADNKIETVTIDDYFVDKGKCVSFIKMDIEGAEVEAIKGAALTIKKYRPQLAISVYHKKQDIFEIPLLLKSICPEYRFYLRQFSEHLSETVLLAKVESI